VAVGERAFESAAIRTNARLLCGRLLNRRRPMTGTGSRVVLSGLGRYEVGYGSSTVGAPKPPNDCSQPDDHYNQRTSHRPGFGHRAPFEHRPVHTGHSNDLACRKRAGQGLAVSAPPGTRTPNPRIKRVLVFVPADGGRGCWMPVAQVSSGVVYCHVPSCAGSVGGCRAHTEHTIERCDLATGSRKFRSCR